MDSTTDRFERPGVRKMVAKPASALAGALALGAGISASSDVDAALIINDINETVSDGSFDIDLNNDSVNDFRITVAPGELGFGNIKTTGKNAIATFDNFAQQLSVGDEVTTSLFVGSAAGSANLYTDGNLGPWGTVGAHGFVGLRLVVDSNVHFGWIEITRGSMIVGRSAFQDVANVAAAVVPTPASAWLFGSAMLGLLGSARRRKTVTTTSVD